MENKLLVQTTGLNIFRIAEYVASIFTLNYTIVMVHTRDEDLLVISLVGMIPCTIILPE